MSRAKILATTIPAMGLPFVASLFYFVLFSEAAFAKVIYTGTKVFTLVWPLLAWCWILRQPRPALELRERRHRDSIPLGIGVGIAIVAFMFALLQTPLGPMVEESAGDIRKKATDLGIASNYWAFAAFLCIFHSLLEEYYWRWFVYGQLSRVARAWTAHVLAGVAFMAHHVVIATQFFPLAWGLVLGALVGVGGVIFSVLYARQRTLVGAWVAHLIVDVGLMVVGHKLIFGTWF